MGRAGLSRPNSNGGGGAMAPDRQTSILVVDDEEEIRHVLRVLLESEGFLVT